MISKDLVDSDRVAIRGGSAGGYTTLRALTTTGMFRAGASYYGVADVRALCSDTHKFESRYIEALVPEDEIDSRSPIHDIDQLKESGSVLSGIRRCDSSTEPIRGNV